MRASVTALIAFVDSMMLIFVGMPWLEAASAYSNTDGRGSPGAGEDGDGAPWGAGRRCRGSGRAGTSRRSIRHRVRPTPRSGDLLLDTGIRPESNTGSGDPSKVADGEVKAHLGDPGFTRSSFCSNGRKSMKSETISWPVASLLAVAGMLVVTGCQAQKLGGEAAVKTRSATVAPAAILTTDCGCETDDQWRWRIFVEHGSGFASGNNDARVVYTFLVRHRPGEGGGSRSEDRTDAVRSLPVVAGSPEPLGCDDAAGKPRRRFAASSF